MSLLGRVEQKNVEERERVVRFLMDIGWHAEAKQELDRLVQRLSPGRPEGAGRQRAALHPSGRGGGAARPRSTSAARRSSTSAWRAAQIVQGERDSDRAPGRGPRDRAA